MTQVINLFAGPGAGKSTTAAGVFRKLKLAGVNCEYVTEFAKDLTWSGRHLALDDQIYVFAKQHHRLFVCREKVDVIVTDSPLMLSSIYAPPETETCMHELVLSRFRSFNNHCYFIDRTKAYNPKGRNQTEAQAKEIDNAVLDMLEEISEPYVRVPGNEEADQIIFDHFTHHYSVV